MWRIDVAHVLHHLACQYVPIALRTAITRATTTTCLEVELVVRAIVATNV